MSDLRSVPQAQVEDSRVPNPGVTVVGWLIICFSAIPVVLGAGDGSRAAILVGLAMALVVAVLAVIGRRVRARLQATRVSSERGPALGVAEAPGGEARVSSLPSRRQAAGQWKPGR